MEDLQARARRFAQALDEVWNHLDWEELGRLYCHEGGEAFFPPAQRDAIQEAGLAFAAELGELLPRGGASHYVGAAIAELPLILCEHLVLDRRIHWTQLPGPEADALARVMGAVGAPTPCTQTSPSFPVDHLWMVSVLTDPEAFPALHDELYGRQGLGGDRGGEHRRAARLVREVLARLKPPAILSTTDEELPFFLEACAELDLWVQVPDQGRLSGIVGDVVRHLHVRS